MKFLKCNFLFFVVIFSLVSCYKNLDFKQVDTFTSSQVVETSLIYFKIKEPAFIDAANNIELSSVSDITEFTLLNTDRAKNNLQRVDLYFEIKNEFNRSFDTRLQFLDENDQIVFSDTLNLVRPKQLNYKDGVEIIIAKNAALLNSNKIKLTLNISGGQALDSTSVNEFEFKSSGKYYFKF
ncbi:hypothetical protein OD91_2272 [Lutibacter sp. Hel_I_33_5]|uniref:hypothetical protein n=1 Tax=Lutibacter sp. Hel_I_33_5 TaxID=1566289 RepID=UPI0011A5FC17|nr:hypothetical protein [Lutibacter sp. Hel_I_33_5]TVZ56968.1 hypothetical protein OD91_2272 [Lutibacter sp. Hel_I_33_5]